MNQLSEIIVQQPSKQDYYSRGLRSRFRIDKLSQPSSEQLHSANTVIGYEPNPVKYAALSSGRLRTESLEIDVPTGWPKRLEGPLVWTSADFEEESQYIYYLTADNKSEICQALEYFKEQELDGDRVSRDNFPLPTLGPHLEDIRDEIYLGRGFAIIRGLNPDDYSAEDLTIIFLGLSSYIAERRGKQDQRGSMLVHVRKYEQDELDTSNNRQMPFHSDVVCDVLGLLTRRCSERSERSILSSGWTVYNELAKTRPDVLHVLSKPNWPFDTFGRVPPFYRRALLYWHDGKVIWSFARRLLTGHPKEPRTTGIPSLTETQAEALETVHFTAMKYQIHPTIRAGDIRFVNNMAVLHSRERLNGGPDTSRHLVRMWLNNPTMVWKLPFSLELAWARVFEDDEREEHWDIEPPYVGGIPLRTRVSCD